MTQPDRNNRKPVGASLPAQRHQRSDDANAFIPEPEAGTAHTDDSLAENLAEEYLESATSGEERGEEAMNEVVIEEIGGPFIETTSALEPDELKLDTREPRRRSQRRKRR